MIDRILFIGDLSRGQQAGNVRKLSTLFSPVFDQLGVKWSVHISSTNDLTDGVLWLDSWRDSLVNGAPSPLSKLDLNRTMVVGFEMPPGDLHYLSNQEVPWVNLEIHPLRFLDDLYFNVTSSFNYDLLPLSAGLGLIRLCANALQITCPVDKLVHKSKKLAIFGQTPFDKSVLFDGNFKLLDSYFDQIDILAAEHNDIIYRPHPLLTNSDLDEEICRRYGAKINSDRNIYGLLASGDIATICAISSSVVSEAPFFGIRGVFLEQRAKRFGSPISYARLLDESKFWLSGLGDVPMTAYLSMSQAIPKNYLRNNFGFWGYVTQERDLEERMINAEKKAQQTEIKMHEAVYLLHQQANGWHEQILAMQASASWKMTSPLRVINRMFNTLFRK